MSSQFIFDFVLKIVDLPVAGSMLYVCHSFMTYLTDPFTMSVAGNVGNVSSTQEVVSRVHEGSGLNTVRSLYVSQSSIGFYNMYAPVTMKLSTSSHAFPLDRFTTQFLYDVIKDFHSSALINPYIRTSYVYTPEPYVTERWKLMIDPQSTLTAFKSINDYTTIDHTTTTGHHRSNVASLIQDTSNAIDHWTYHISRPIERFFADVYMTDEIKAREEFEKTYAATEMNWTRF